MMYVVLLVAAVALVIGIERTLFLHRGQIRSKQFIEGIKNALAKRRIVEALTLCEEAPGGAVESLLNCLDDCSLLLVREISGSTGGKLRIGWITVWEAPMPADKALSKLRNSPMFRRALGIGLRG